jgi:hypothetical protein
MTTTGIEMEDFDSDDHDGDDDTEDTAEAPEVPKKKSPGRSPRKTRGFRSIEHRETFGYQPTPSAELPEPQPWVEMMVSGVLESIHGVRDTRQFVRWMTNDVYNAVEARAKSVRLRHQTLKKPIPRPVFTLGNIVLSTPRDGVVEAAAVVHGPTRVRAVAIRLEGLDHRWMTTSFRML